MHSDFASTLFRRKIVSYLQPISTPTMKTSIRIKAVFTSAGILGMFLFISATTPAATVLQTINQSGSGDWTQAIWGTPAAVATADNDYITGTLGGVFCAVRTINTTAAQSFAGDHLILTNGGVLYLKNAGGPCNANVVVDGGQIIFHGSGGTDVQLGGTLRVNFNNNTVGGPAGTTGAVFYNLGQDQTGANTRNILLQGNISGSGDLIVNMNTVVAGTTANTLAILGTNTSFTGNWTNNNGIIEIRSGSVNPLGSGTATLATTSTFLSFNSTNDLVITNSIFGVGAVAKFNSNTITLNGSNTFTGRTTISNGVLRIGANSSLTNSAVISLAGGTLDITAIGGLQMNTANSQQMTNCNGGITGDLTASTGNTLNFNVSPTTNDILNIAGALTLNGSPTLNVTLTGFKPSGTYRLINYTGTIQGGGSFTLSSPTGSSETFSLDTSTPGQVNLIVSGAVNNLTWTGATDGDWDTTTPNWTGDASVFSTGDNVTFDDTGSSANPINFVANAAPSSITISNTVNQYVFGVLALGTPPGIVTAGGLTKLGTNEVDFVTSGNNIGGLINIQAGILSIGNGAAGGSLGTGPITNNGILRVNMDANGVAFNAPISGSGSLEITGDGFAGVSVSIGGNGHNSYTGTTTIGNQCQLNIATSNALGAASGGTIVQSGGRLGVVSVVGTMTVAEPVKINGTGINGFPGALYVNDPNNNVTWSGPITVASDSLIRAVNNGRMSFSNTVLGNDVALQCVVGNPATPTETNTTITFQNTLSLGGGSLFVDGIGMVVLANNTNVWSGGTTVNGGRLLVNGKLDGGAVTVNTGTNSATLGGSGTVLGSVIVDGSLAPGNSGIGTLTVSNSVTLNSDATTVMELNRTNAQNSDLLVASSVACGGVLQVLNVGPALQGGDTFHLFNATLNNAFDTTNLPTLSSPNLSWDTSLLASSGIIRIASSTAPAPTNTPPQINGTNFVFQTAPTVSGFNYILQVTPTLAPAVWTNVQTNAGTGGPLNFSFPITSGNPQEFFRISVQ